MLVNYGMVHKVHPDKNVRANCQYHSYIEETENLIYFEQAMRIPQLGPRIVRIGSGSETW